MNKEFLMLHNLSNMREKNNLRIYQGNCRYCSIGIKTHLKDNNGKVLYTGDIVNMFQSNRAGKKNTDIQKSMIVYNGYITYDVYNPFSIYSKKYVFNKYPERPFVMGIKSVMLHTFDEDGLKWNVIFHQSYKTLKPGMYDITYYKFNIRDD